MKGKDIVLSDFSLQQNNDDSNPNEIIPLSFDMHKILEDNMNNFDKYNDNFGNEKYLIQTHSQAKMSGTKLPEVHGVQKGLDPNLRPEKQHTIPNKVNQRGHEWVKEGQDQRGKNLIPSKKKPTIRCNTGNSRKNQNSDRENKQHTQYKQHE